MPESNLFATYLRKNEIVNIQIYSKIMAPCQTICIYIYTYIYIIIYIERERDPPKEIKFQRHTFNRKTSTPYIIVDKHAEYAVLQQSWQRKITPRNATEENYKIACGKPCFSMFDRFK